MQSSPWDMGISPKLNKSEIGNRFPEKSANFYSALSRNDGVPGGGAFHPMSTKVIL